MTGESTGLHDDRAEPVGSGPVGSGPPTVGPGPELSAARRWAALLGLATGAFLFVTLEVLPVGLLAQFAEGLGVSQSTAGLLVTGHAMTVVATAVPLTAALARVNRRGLLVALLATMAGGAVIAAASPNFGVLLAARVLVATAQGVFWTMSAALAAAVMGPQRMGRGVAVVFGGISLAQVGGVPLFTLLGQTYSWRVAVAVLAGAAAVTAVVVLVALPDLPAVAGGGRSSLRPVLGNRRLVGAAVAIGVSFAAVYVTLTYFAPVVRELTGTSARAIPAFLVVFGVAGVLGNAVAGMLVDRRLPVALAGALGGVAGAAVLLGAGGGWLPLAVLAIGLWGLCGSAFPTTFQTWALSLAPGQPENAGSLVVVAVNLGLAGGALLGGVLLGHGAPVLVGTTAVLLVGVLTAVQVARLLRRPG